MKKRIIVLAATLIIILTSGFVVCHEVNDEVVESDTLENIETNESEKVEVINKITVEIKGEVVNPGVYEIEENKRVSDLIELAGGLTPNALTININQAKKLKDEMVIIIYNKNDVVEDVKTEYVYLECDCPAPKNDACLKEEDEVVETKKVSINKASLEELTSINGIGTKTAEKIINYRNENKFNTIEDIKKVSGIGDSLYEKIKDYITI